MPKLNNATQAIRLTRGIASELTSAEHAYGQLSQLLHITDTNEVYIHNGTKFVPIITNRTPSSATDTGIKGGIHGDSCIASSHCSGDSKACFMMLPQRQK